MCGCVVRKQIDGIQAPKMSGAGAAASAATTAIAARLPAGVGMVLDWLRARAWQDERLSPCPRAQRLAVATALETLFAVAAPPAFAPASQQTVLRPPPPPPATPFELAFGGGRAAAADELVHAVPLPRAATSASSYASPATAATEAAHNTNNADDICGCGLLDESAGGRGGVSTNVGLHLFRYAIHVLQPMMYVAEVADDDAVNAAAAKSSKEQQRPQHVRPLADGHAHYRPFVTPSAPGVSPVADVDADAIVAHAAALTATARVAAGGVAGPVTADAGEQKDDAHADDDDVQLARRWLVALCLRCGLRHNDALNTPCVKVYRWCDPESALSVAAQYTPTLAHALLDLYDAYDAACDANTTMMKTATCTVWPRLDAGVRPPRGEGRPSDAHSTLHELCRKNKPDMVLFARLAARLSACGDDDALNARTGLDTTPLTAALYMIDARSGADFRDLYVAVLLLLRYAEPNGGGVQLRLLIAGSDDDGGGGGGKLKKVEAVASLLRDSVAWRCSGHGGGGGGGDDAYANATQHLLDAVDAIECVQRTFRTQLPDVLSDALSSGARAGGGGVRDVVTVIVAYAIVPPAGSCCSCDCRVGGGVR